MSVVTVVVSDVRRTSLRSLVWHNSSKEKQVIPCEL